MKSSLRAHDRTFFPQLALAAALALTNSSVLAIEWDTDSAAGIQPADGDWNAATANWSSDGTNLVGWVDPDLPAEFGGGDGNYTITLTETINAAGLVFNNSGYYLSGDGAERLLDLKAGASNILLADGTFAEIGTDVKLRTYSHRLGTPEGTNGGTLTIGEFAKYEARGTANIAVDGLGTTLEVAGLVDTVNGELRLGNNKVAPQPGTPITDVTVKVLPGGNLIVDFDPTQIGWTNTNNAVPDDVKGTLIIEGTATLAEVRVGQFGSGVFQILEGGEVTAANIALGNGGSAKGQLDLEGVLTCNTLNIKKADSIANFNGGILIPASVDPAGLIQGGVGTINVREFGLTIDTDGLDVSVTRDLAHSSIPGDPAIDGGLTKDGAGKLTLTADNTYTGPTTIFEGTLQVGDGGTAGSISDDVTNDGELVFNRSDDLVLSGTITGTGALTHIGAGRLSLTGFTGGDTTVTTGILELDNGDALSDSTRLTVDGTGSIELTQSETVNTLYLGSSPQAAGTYGTTGSGAANTDDTLFSGPGILTVLTTGVAETQLWDTDAADGIQPLSGNWNTTETNWTSNGTLLQAWDPGLPSVFGGGDTTATITVTEDLSPNGLTFDNSGFSLVGDDPLRTLLLGGRINLGDGTDNSIGSDLTIDRTGTLRIGQAAGSNGGQLNVLNGGTVQSSGDMTIEGLNTSVTVSGTLQVTGGTGRINLGSNQTFGTDVSLTIESGGQVLTETAGSTANTIMQVGFALIGSDPANVKGTVTVKDGGLLRIGTSADRVIRLGQYGTGTLNVEENGLVQSAAVVLGNGGNGTGFLNLSGTVETDNLNLNKKDSRANFDGGTLKALAGGTELIKGSSAPGRNNVRNGGLIVDTNGVDKSISQPLHHSDIEGDSPVDGGLTKAGAGTLTLSEVNTYNGLTTVLDGTLNLDNGDAIPDTNSIVIQGSGLVGLAQNETVDKLFYDANEVSEAIGTYGASGSGADNIDNARFSGPGVLTVLSSGTLSDYDDWLAGFTFVPGADTTMSGNADGDGLTNKEEYAFGLDPSDALSANPTPVPLSKAQATFSYTRRDPLLTSLNYRIWTSPDLQPGNWTEDPTATQAAGDTDANGNQTVVVTLSAGAPLPDDQLFIRVTAE